MYFSRFGPTVYGLKLQYEVFNSKAIENIDFLTLEAGARKNVMCLFPRGVETNDAIHGIKCCTDVIHGLHEGRLIFYSNC